MAAPSAGAAARGRVGDERVSRALLTVVVPVYNGGDEVVANVGVIRRAVSIGLPGEEVEVIVVSDGSIDGTVERLLEARHDPAVRIIHYERNLGKGYAVKIGALAARGEWVAMVDCDLDLDPSSIPDYLAVARGEGLDFAIGSKRHPSSIVYYPPTRRLASWCYQQLNRLLFGLDVRDTQVGLKVFSRRVVEEVMPLLLVKQFAFDLELLAVASTLGFRRIRELPVRLEYHFRGSGLTSRAVARALVDTAAVFYRLRVLRTYQRKRRLTRGSLTEAAQPLVSVVGHPEGAALLDYPHLEILDGADVAAARAARGELVALLQLPARPAGNWVTASLPYFADPSVAAVVVPTVAPATGRLRERIAAAVLESRLGGGSRRTLAFPGALRVVADHPGEAIVVRRGDLLSALDAAVDRQGLVSWLARRGRRTVYTPEASVSAAPAPLVRPHLQATVRHGRGRGAAARQTRGASLSAATALSFVSPACALAGLAATLLGQGSRTAGLALLLVYAGVLVVGGLLAGLRFGSLAVAVLQPMAVALTQAAYVLGFLWGLACPGWGLRQADASTATPS